MDRVTGRAEAQAALEATTSYVTVYDHEPDSFNGASPVATVHSKSLGVKEFAHGEIMLIGTLWISLYVRRDGTNPADLETQMDTLARQAVLTLRNVFADSIADATINPSEGGYMPVDGTMYRVERFVVQVVEEIEG